MRASYLSRGRNAAEYIYDVIVGWVNAHHDAKTGAVDPVLEAIEAHRQALEGVKKAFAPGADDEFAMEDAVDAENETLLDFFYTEPTTIAGALAALEFASTNSLMDAAFDCTDGDFAEACTAWPAMIAGHVRRLIESHAWFNHRLFGPLVAKG